MILSIGTCCLADVALLFGRLLVLGQGAAQFFAGRSGGCDRFWQLLDNAFYLCRRFDLQAADTRTSKGIARFAPLLAQVRIDRTLLDLRDNAIIDQSIASFEQRRQRTPVAICLAPSCVVGAVGSDDPVEQCTRAQQNDH